MHTIRNMYEVIFPNIYILLDIIYSFINYNYCFANNGSRFQRPGKLTVTFLQCIMVTSKIKHDFFLDFLLFQTKEFITLWLRR